MVLAALICHKEQPAQNHKTQIRGATAGITGHLLLRAPSGHAPSGFSKEHAKELGLQIPQTQAMKEDDCKLQIAAWLSQHSWDWLPGP